MKITQKVLSWAIVIMLAFGASISLASPHVDAAPRGFQRLAMSPGTKFPVTSYTNDIKAIPGADVTHATVEIPENVSASPWRLEVIRKGQTQWKPVKYAINDGSEMYLSMSIDGTANAGNYPGGAFALKGYDPIGAPQRTDGMMLCPLYNEWFDDPVSWAFTAPVTGIYQFSRSSDDTTRSFDESQYFAFIAGKNDSTKNLKHGVRITVDGEPIWPKASDGVTQENGWAIVTPGVENRILVPTVPDIDLASGQVLRLESKGFGAADNTWDTRMFGSALMEYVSAPPVDSQAPEFPSEATITNNPAAATDTTLSISWPMATDNETDQNNITYKVFTSTSAITSLDDLTGETAVAKTTHTLKDLTADTDYYVAVAAYDLIGNYSFISAGAFKTLPPPPPVLNTYEIYDYYEDVQAVLDEMPSSLPSGVNILTIESDSPWRPKIQVDNTWTSLNTATRASDGYIYLIAADAAWGNFPGVSFYAPKDYDGVTPRDLSFLTPVNAGSESSAPGFKANSSLVFTAPQAGVYTFRRSNPDRAHNTDDTKYFRAISPDAVDLEFGMRLKVNDTTIWPVENNGLTIKEGFAKINGYSGTKNEKWIEVPKISGIALKAGEELVLETTAFTSASMPWDQKITACVAMDMNAEMGEDTQAPVFASGSISKVSATGVSLTVQWPEATDDQTSGSGIKYSVYADITAFDINSLPTTAGTVVMGENSVEILNLESGVEYYVLVVAEDAAGNKSGLTSGPFITLGTDEDIDPDEEDPDLDEDIDPIEITEPLTPTMGVDNAGIITSSSDMVKIGWNAAAGVTGYRVYLFSRTADGYLVEESSDLLSVLENEYTFTNLSDKYYEIQVLGYNIQDEITAVYSPLSLDLREDNGGGPLTPPATGDIIIFVVVLNIMIAALIIVTLKQKRKNQNQNYNA